MARGLTVTLWRQKRIQSPNSTGPCNLEPHGRILPQLSLLIIQCYRNREGKVHPQRDRSHDAGAGTGNHGSRQELKIGPRDQVPTVISDLETQTQPFGQRRACRIVRSAYPGGGIDCTSLEMASRETQELADPSLTSNRCVRGRLGRRSLSLKIFFFSL